MPLRVGSFQGTLRFRHSFIVTGSFLAAFHPPHASLLRTSSPLNGINRNQTAATFFNETGKKAAK